MTVFDTNDVSNDVIFNQSYTRYYDDVSSAEEYFLWSRNSRNLFFHRREVSFAAAFMLRGLMTVVSSMGTEDRYVNFRRRLHRFSQ